MGTPSGTGGTTSPYGWMCLGLYGGASESCSIPTARIENDEVFAGQNALGEKVKAAGPLRGILTVLDFTAATEDPSHADLMKDNILYMGVPEENLVVVGGTADEFLSGDKWRDLREETLVIATPTTFAVSLSQRTLGLIMRQNSLFVAGAINRDTLGYDDRDLWYPEHPHWGRNSGRYENAFAAFATGKFILATLADLVNGEVVPYGPVVKCGLAKEFCYSVIRHPDRYPDDGWGQGTSDASTFLGALTFYLFQLWDTPQEVVGVLNECAEDVGEPGIDEEFGRGIVSVVCDMVQHKERRVVSSSLQTSYAASPVLSEMLGSSKVPLQMSARSFFYELNPYSGTGHVGKQFSVGGNDLFLSGGLSRMPLGVRTFLRQAHRVPFMEIGSRRPFYERNGHKVSLLGTYGQSAEDGFSVRAGHLGLRYELTLPSAALSLHTGYRLASGRLGLPGFEVVGAAPVPFTTGAPELSFSLALGL